MFFFFKSNNFDSVAINVFSPLAIFFLINWWCRKHHLYIPPKRKTIERGTKANTFQQSLFLEKSALAWDGMSFIERKELIDSPIYAKLSAPQFPSLNIRETMKFICFVKSMQFSHLFLMFYGTKDEDLTEPMSNQFLTID